MQSDDSLIQDIMAGVKVPVQDPVPLRCLLEQTYKVAEELKLNLTLSRWIALGNHYAAMINRLQAGDKLPPVEEEAFNEISAAAEEASAFVLRSYHEQLKLNIDRTEIFLLAVHFEAALQW
ncbi:PRD domain-containing protein [Paenibacillus larvae]|uniref:PRD domain-containing protein n=1 Tax=Paenibacillus larvae TaxID=1464 RepID=UPI00293C8458|nr:PRD domain-containing protein [Paenibacillus larvae]MDV3430362.1 PRD domain-containing protein [Paenibacillus larvae]MDV3444374.1 PRD domain-containing protein [Paenibacillus larvae]MDV3483068.1 PRD domain-containing protein [Paenibacillus larvae]